jgi:hypothetical protein
MRINIPGLGPLDFDDQDVESCAASELAVYAEEFEALSLQSKRFACALRYVVAERIRSGEELLREGYVATAEEHKQFAEDAIKISPFALPSQACDEHFTPSEH